VLTLAAWLTAAARGHDIPNQRVDRSIQVTVTPGRLQIDYEVSLTELTLTQDLRRLIGSLPGADRSGWLARYGQVSGPLNAKGVLVAVDGHPQPLITGGYDLAIEEHPRYTFHFHAPIPGKGRISIRDTNYQSSEGTSRLAVRGRDGVILSGDDLPSDVSEIPIRPVFLLSDDEERRTKEVEVTFRGPEGPPAKPGAETVAAPAGAASTEPSFTSESRSLRGISALLDRAGTVPWFLVLIFAAGLGAAHAIQPGHGKTLVTAVALAPRARLYQPALLGLATTVAHTGSVLLIALVLWYTHATEVADVHRGLTRGAGFAIAAVGLWRVGRYLGGYPEHENSEARAGGDLSNVATVGLGLAGGIVPCWDAVGLLILAAAVGRLGAGVALVLAFSAGMAAVLVAVGWLVWKLKSRAIGPARGPRWLGGLGLASGLLLAAMGLYLFLES
jgi:nickel/cobalt transporter (NicO) family protein